MVIGACPQIRSTDNLTENEIFISFQSMYEEEKIKLSKLFI